MKSIQSISMSKQLLLALTLITALIATGDVIAAPVTATVTSTGDAGAFNPVVSPSVTPSATGPVTLRSAIQYFNATNIGIGANTINFDISTLDSGYNPTTNTWTITPFTDLDAIVVPLTINGYTFPGALFNTATPNTLAQGDNAVLQIVLNGSKDAQADGNFFGNGLHFFLDQVAHYKLRDLLSMSGF